MPIPNEILSSNPGLDDWAILSAYRGSIAHGMYVPASDPNSIDDKDIMAVCVPQDDYYLGLGNYGTRGTQEIKQGEWDIVIYEAKKFISLLAQGNPNVLSMLWLDEQYYIKKTYPGQLLISRRELFVGKHVYRSFVGYAYSQLHRMTHHAFEGHLGAKRRGLVEKYGYDCKNAAHLIRLLRMGAEFLTEGQLFVTRHDAKQLLEIKRGEWTLEQVLKEADKGFSLAEQAYVNSKLPERPNMDDINALCMHVVSSALSLRHGLDRMEK